MEKERLVANVTKILELGKAERFYEIAQETAANNSQEVSLRKEIIDDLLQVSSLPQVWVSMCFSAIDWADKVSSSEAQHIIGSHFFSLSELSVRLMPYQHQGQEGYIVLSLAVDRKNEKQNVLGSVLTYETETDLTKGSPTPEAIQNLEFKKSSDWQLLNSLTHDPEAFDQLLKKFSDLFEKTIQIAVPIINTAIRVNKEKRDKSKKTLAETAALVTSMASLLP